MFNEGYVQAYDVGEDGDRWMVRGTDNEYEARLAVIELLIDQTWPNQDLNNANDCAALIRDVLELKAITYRFVVADKETELVYSDARFGPYEAYEEGVDWFGTCVAVGFTMPKWGEK